MTDYLYWQFVLGPSWLLTLAWNLQRAMARMFSVKLMLKTLVAHWHRDIMPNRGGIEGLIMAILWNLISRAIGFVMRSIVIGVWLCAAAFLAFVSVSIVVLFVVWPAIIGGGVVWSFILMAAG